MLALAPKYDEVQHSAIITLAERNQALLRISRPKCEIVLSMRYAQCTQENKIIALILEVVFFLLGRIIVLTVNNG